MAPYTVGLEALQRGGVGVEEGEGVDGQHRRALLEEGGVRREHGLAGQMPQLELMRVDVGQRQVVFQAVLFGYRAGLSRNQLRQEVVTGRNARRLSFASRRVQSAAVLG
jgi:hypothetical protein